MTAATLEDTTLLGAPRASVEDAWRTLNTRYATGTAAMAAALALMWAVGMGPGSTRDADFGTPPGTGATAITPRAASETVTSRASTGAEPAASGTVSQAPGSAPTTGGTGIGATAGAAAGTAAGAAAGSAASNGSAASAGTAPGSASSAAASGAATANGGTGANGAASPLPNASGSAGTNGTALPRPIPGAPVVRLYFEPDQSWPSGEVGKRLAPVLARLKAEPDTKALVSGFHDRRGPSPERNAQLAQRRAQAVRRALIREGIPATRIVLAKPQQLQGSGPDREARRVEVSVAR